MDSMILLYFLPRKGRILAEEWKIGTPYSQEVSSATPYGALAASY